jgi:dipeptidyl aminopeptidase/acylaminoacyl peptidase
MALVSMPMIAAVASLCAAADEPVWPSNEDLRHIRAFDDLQLSPDGSSVLLQARDPTVDGARKHLWLLDPQGGAPRQLTYSPETDKDGESSARWMPDGRSVLFIAHRGEHAELYRLAMAGGEALKLPIEVPVAVDDSKAADALPPIDTTNPSKPVTTLPVEVKSYGVNASGEWLWVIADDPQTPGEKAQVEAKADANWVDHETHGTHLYLWNLATRKTIVVPLHDDVAEAAWSPDGAWLAVVTQAPHHGSDVEPTRRVWLVSIAHPENPEALAECPRQLESFAWDAAGRELYFYSQATHDAPPGYPDLFVDELATHRVRNLTDGLDGTPAGNIVSLAGGGAAVPIARGFDWTLQGYGSGPESKRVLRHPVGSIASLATNANHSAWVWIESRSGHEPEIWYAASPTEPGKRLSAPPFHASGPRRSAEALRVEWNLEGRTLQGLLYLPTGAGQPSGSSTVAHAPVPLIVEGHGGPTYAFTDQFSAWVDFLVGQGWAVFRPNPRGSTMRGAAFAAANKNDLGGGDVRDILAGVDHVLKHYPVDGRQMAFIGYSYGGELAGFMEGQTTRFRAIVSGAPVIDQFSEYGTEDDSYYDRWFYGFPWQHFADAWRQSPLAGVGRQKGGTPMLLIQGQTDETDPPGQSYEMYRALRQAQVPVELVTYPREGHSTLARGTEGEPSKEPWHGFDARRHIVEFIKANLHN